ncbi:DUF2529 family protein [Paenalkalicoccus suaedae]|uniref:DUF2529 family protein n=1 Tax=Paenalkalicoccus suaedae TaxID=2592382 RepID=A0A859FJD1_9BACI|nr:DUF2529 family protein [Paenalkalicoccus suaedae]QKS72785.1 DUF2529 family protein [Paenalkalicoccus suaedae]
MKIFDTQLKGLLQKLDQFEEDFEDASRMLAQSILGDGAVYWYTEEELDGIFLQTQMGTDAITKSARIEECTEAHPIDTALFFAKSGESEELRAALEKVAGMTTIVFAPKAGAATEGASFVIETGVTRGLIPMEDGSRVGEPHLLMALQAYYRLYFLVTEILEEYA